MGCDVFANNNEIACKAGDGKVIAAFPDVCLSPPSPPAGPVPIPYPDTSFSKDMMSGSKTVKIKNQEVMLKDQSFYNTRPLGDEAATNGLGAGVVTHVITGKTYFTMWSMDVKIEGQNVDRHFDITTSNHMSPPGNEGVPMPNVAMIAPPAPAEDKCECCKKPKHSKGPEVSEDQFYNTPQSQAVLNEVQSSNCKDLLPQPPCNKYYVTTKKEKDRIETEWDEYRPEYYQKNGLPPQTQVGHRVPKAAGGCPTGDGNLGVVKPECEELEGKLSKVQGQRIQSHRKARGIT